MMRVPRMLFGRPRRCDRENSSDYSIVSFFDTAVLLGTVMLN